MKDIIVTVTDENKTFSQDVEIPVELTIQKLKIDLSDALRQHNLFYSEEKIKLFHCRSNSFLNDGTLETEGVWNGDYIIVI